MNLRIKFPALRWAVVLTWSFVLLLSAHFMPTLGQISVISNGTVTAGSRQIKLLCKVHPDSKGVVGTSGTIEIAGAAFRVGDVSRITVSDGSTTANLLTDIQGAVDGTEVIKFGYFAAQPLSGGDTLFQLILIPTGAAISAGSSVEIRLKGTKTTADGFIFSNQLDTSLLIPVVQSNNTRPRFTLVSRAEFFRSRANEFKLTAVDAESPAGDLKYTLSGSPSGMVVTELGLIKWTPGQEVPVGQGKFTVSVEDPEGGKDSMEIAYSVREAEALSLRVDQSWLTDSASVRSLQVTLSLAELPVPINGLQFKMVFPAHLRVAGESRSPKFLSRKTLLLD